MEKYNFDVTINAGAYTEEPAELIKNTIVKSKFANYVTFMTGVKSSETVNYIGGGVTIQAGGTCGFNASGTREVSQRTVSVCKLKVNENFCMKKMEAYFTQKLLSPGSTYDEDDIPQIFREDLQEKVSYENELIVFQGNTATGTGNLALCDGFIKLCDDTSTVVRASSGVTFVGNEITVMKSIVNSIPENIRNSAGLQLLIGQDWFDLYQQEIFDLNNRWVAPEDGTDGRLLFTNIPIIVMPGLTGTNRIILTEKENMIVGTDLENEEEDFKFWFSMDDDIHKLKVEWKIGVQFAFPENVVYYAQ